MSTEQPSQFNLLYNLLFMAVIGLVLYLIPQPSPHENMIVFELSRNPEKAEARKVAYEEKKAEASTEETVEPDAHDPETAPAQQPVEEKREYAEELIEEGKSTRKVVSDGFGTSSFSAVEANDALTDVEYFREYSRIYKEQKLKGVQPESRTDVVIRYYAKEKDGDKIFRLRALGFYVHERPTSEKFDQYASNAIYYGDKVSLEDIKMVAYTLMRQGVDIKTIEPSQFFSDWKAHSIEIGADDTMQDAPSLTLGDIRQLRF
ncbi:MAG: hypothetical protein RIF33_15175 [Cyclobacteriaceae bacterium]